MKKRIWLGVLAIVLVFGLVFASCDEANDNGNGNGEWEEVDLPPMEGDVSSDWTTLAFIFNDEEVTLTRGSGSEGSLDGVWNGTADGTSIMVTVSGQNWTAKDTGGNDVARGTITISGTIITITITHMFNSGGGNGGDGFIGGTLNLSGQVWTWDDDGDIVQFTGNRATVISYPGGSGSITNGQLSFSIGTPALENMQQLLGGEMGELFNNFSLSPSGARGTIITMLMMPGGESLGNVVGTSNSSESVIYFYVDRDVRMTGTGRTITFGGETVITRNLNLNLQAGWNAITLIEEWNPNTRTETLEMIAGASPRARWMLGHYADPPPRALSESLTDNLGNARSLFRSR